MKITQKLEWDYEENKITSTDFMTRDTIKDVVAADLFIPIVEELYDKNIFTNWSGLTGNAHIRIPLDGLSKENFLIAKQNCENNPNHWKLQRPPYKDVKNLLPNYTFEIYVEYEEGLTEVSDVVDQLLKEVFDWCVNYFNYAYSGLNYAYAEQEWRKESDENLTKYYRIYCRNNNSQCELLGLGSRKKFLKDSKNNTDIPNKAIVRTQKIIEHLEECEKCKQKEKGFISGNTDSVWLSKYGVCMNFAEIYEFLCENFSLPCKHIQGSIDSEGYNVGHAWNAIMINGKLKYVDISSAIHCKDRSNTINLPEDFFGKTFEELQTIDGGKNRKIAEGFEKSIKELINSSEGWNVGD